MRKQAFLKSLLILLPVLAVGLAAAQDSVQVLDTLTGTMTRYSYFDILPVEAYQMLPPTAAMLSVLSGILAALFLIRGKSGLLKASGVTAILSATVAVLPYLHTAQVRVFPHVGLPIFMIAHYALAYTLSRKKPEQTTDTPRLGQH